MPTSPWLVVLFTRALFVPDASVTPPDFTVAEAREVALPHVVGRDDGEFYGAAWYQLELPGPAPLSQVPWSVYLPRLNMNAEVWLNGEPLGSGGISKPGGAANWNRPLFFSFPASALNRTTNTVQIRLFFYDPTFGALSPVYIGAEPALRPVYEAEWFVRISMGRMATAIAVVLGLLMGLFWYLRRDPAYGWLALGTLVYAIHSLNFHVSAHPVPPTVWDWLAHVSIDWTGVCTVFFAHRWSEVSRPRLERIVLVWAVASPIINWIADAQVPTTNVLHVVTLVLCVYAAWVVFQRFRQLPRTDLAICVVGVVSALGMGLHDLGIQLQLLSPDRPRLLAYAMLPVVTAFAAVLITQFLRAFREVEALNLTLEQRVADKAAELESTYQRTQKLESDRVVSVERERIMREMHDGMGGHLVSAVAMVRYGGYDDTEMLKVLQGALDEMRLVIDSLDPDVDDLASLLGMIRVRLEPRLRDVGLRFKWGVQDTPPLDLGPGGWLHVLRIVQESVTNIAKHAGATTIGVETGIDNGHVFVRISDDGRGLPDDAAPGRGLGNMYQRAQELGGTLAVEPSVDGGTLVTLRLPVSARGVQA